MTDLCETGRSGGLTLTIGVPGAGKTQLGEKFADDVADSKVGGRKVSALMISPEELSEPLTLFKRMAATIGEERKAVKIAQIDDRVSNVKVQVAGFGGGGVAKDMGRHTAEFPGLLRESMEKGLWKKKALVLIVDELQRVSDKGMETLCVLHDNVPKCPVLLMGFGLQHTPERLANRSRERSISRVAEPITLRSLDFDTTVDAFARNLAAVGYDDLPDESLKTLAMASHGFPQHINGYLKGAHGALIQHGHLKGCALAEALDHGRKRRVAYYNRRLAAAHSRGPMLTVVAEMHRVGTNKLEYHEAKNALVEAGFGKQELDDAIQHGALVCDGSDDSVSFGIPSFHDYMQHLLERQRNLARSTTVR